MSSLRLYDSHDPWFNPAVEECIFRQMPASQRVLFLWRNAQTVVIGHAQNPWKECNTRRMAREGVRLARRSGGGAVFHDLGNTCFTFMASKTEYDKSLYTAIMLNGLRRQGVEARASGRNELAMDTPDGERKISGSSYRQTADRGFHHGAVLLHADLSRLAHYLNPDVKKLHAKGITSVLSRVANVANGCLGSIMPSYVKVCSRRSLTTTASQWRRSAFRRKTPPTCRGSTTSFVDKAVGSGILAPCRPSATCSIPVLSGGVELHFDIEHGAISRCRIFTDSLNSAPLEALVERLPGGGGGGLARGQPALTCTSFAAGAVTARRRQKVGRADSAGYTEDRRAYATLQVFTNSYHRCLLGYYSELTPTPLKGARLLYHKDALARDLALDSALFTGEKTGERLLHGMQPLAQVYSGHQFGVGPVDLGMAAAYCSASSTVSGV